MDILGEVLDRVRLGGTLLFHYELGHPWSLALPARPHAVFHYLSRGAATLALVSLALLPNRAGLVSAWLFNVWGFADLLNAFYQANRVALVPGELGAAYFIPTLGVPLLLITHLLAFRILLRHESSPAMRASHLPA